MTRLGDRGLRILATVLFATTLAFAGAAVVLHLLNDGVRSNLEASPLEAPVYLAFPIVGMVLAFRRPRLPFGWMLLVMGFFFVSPLPGYARYAAVARGGELPAGELALAIETPMWVVFVGLSVFLLLLFPDGHLPSSRWRWFARVAAGGFALQYAATLVGPSVSADYGLPGLGNPLRVEGLEWLLASFAVVPVGVVGGAAAMIVRIRRARDPVRRQQLRLLAWSAGVIALLYTMALLPAAFGVPRDSGVSNALGIAAAMSFTLIPVTIGVAVLRYRLYDIDVVINKTIVYGSLAVLTTGLYVAIVVGLGSLIGGGERSVGLSLGATAMVAVVFQPARQRVQRFANRVVYGDRSAPYDVLSHLSTRMTGTFETDEVLPRLARLLGGATGATRVEVWLRVGDRLHLEASSPPREPRAPALALAAGDVPQLPGASFSAPVRDDGELLGALALEKAPGDPVTPPERKLTEDVARQAALLLRNVRLIEELRASRERIVAAQDDERRRLERDIHDGAQQQLVTLSLATRLAQSSLGSDAPAALTDLLERAVEESKQAHAELRELARGIHPRILTERGLPAAIRSLAERAPVPVRVEAEPDGRLPEAIEATAYFAVSEALQNVAKYAEAGSATVSVNHRDGMLLVQVRDDGIGGADPSRGSGLRGLIDRIDAVGGRLEVESPAGGGTRLTVVLPLG